MTPDKCEHYDGANKRPAIATSATDGKNVKVNCYECGQRFVPSDVLEEALDLVDRRCAENMALQAIALQAKDLATVVDGSVHSSDAVRRICAEFVRRVDAVLGKKT